MDVEQITVQFRRIYSSGVTKDSYIVSTVYNSAGEGVDFNKAEEIQKHNIIIKKDDLQNGRELRNKVFSSLYYMVKYQAFIIVKEGNTRSKNVILSGTLSKLLDLKFIAALTEASFSGLVMSDSVLDVYEDWKNIWSDNGNLPAIWNDNNEFIPFYILPDEVNGYDRFRQLFESRSGVNVEYLV